MARLETAVLEDVVVVRDGGTALLCLAGTKQVWVPLSEIRYGTNVIGPHDRGKLIVSTWFAQNLGLR
jgi:hypothetical protein